MRRITYASYMCHHGVKGQKWGVRRYQDKNGRLTAAGKARQSKDSGGQIDPKTGLLMKQGKTSIESDLKAVNPGYSNLFGSSKYKSNCGNCSIAFDLRRRGYDVHALGNTKGMTIGQVDRFYKGFTKDSFTITKVDESVNNMGFDSKRGKLVKDAITSDLAQKYPDGARGMVFHPGLFASHWMAWEKDGGKVNIYDAQNPKINLEKDVFAYHYTWPENGKDSLNITSLRLDNLEVNKDNIGTIVGNADKKQKKGSFDPYKVDMGLNWVDQYLKDD